MRRSIVLGSVVVVAFAGVGCNQEPKARAADETVPVTVTILCEGDSAVARISPNSVNLPNSNTHATIAEWILNPASTVDEVTIDEKTKDKWPFDTKPPYKATKSKPGKPNGVKPHTSPKKYSYGYTITAYCTFNGESKPFIIDPNMIIIWT